MTKKHSTPSNSTLPNQLWRYRTQMGYSQTKLASLLGFNNTARLCDYEQGKRLPNVAIGLKLSILLGTPIVQLYPDLYAQLKSELGEPQESPRSYANR